MTCEYIFSLFKMLMYGFPNFMCFYCFRKIMCHFLPCVNIKLQNNAYLFSYEALHYCMPFNNFLVATTCAFKTLTWYVIIIIILALYFILLDNLHFLIMGMNLVFDV
jgi:hypothetical protein